VTTQPKPPVEKRSRTPLYIIGGIIIALVLIGIIGVMMSSTSDSDDSASGPTSVDGPEAFIDIRDYKYRPGVISIPRGAQVTWLNDDKVDHTATDKAGAWDSTIIHSEESETVAFDTPGTYQYYCTIHPYMVATITVRPDEPMTPAPSVDATPTPTHN
jgi:plastocyanin